MLATPPEKTAFIRSGRHSSRRSSFDRASVSAKARSRSPRSATRSSHSRCVAAAATRQHHARAHTQTMFSLLHPPPTFAYSLCTLSLLFLQALFHLNMIDLIASPVLHPLLSFAPGAGECVRANEQRDDFIPPTRERRSPSHSPPPSSFLPRPLLLLRCTNSIVAHWRNGHEPVWVARKGTHGATWRRICRAEGGARCDGRRVRVAHND